MKLLDGKIRGLRAGLKQYRRWRKSGVGPVESCDLCDEFILCHHCPNGPEGDCYDDDVHFGPGRARELAAEKGKIIKWRALPKDCRERIARREEVHRARLAELLKQRRKAKAKKK